MKAIAFGGPTLEAIMAKNETTEAPVEAAAAEPEKKTGGHSIVIKVPATPTHPYTVESFKEALAGATVEQARPQFIKEYALTGQYTRSELTAFTRLASGLAADDKKLKYQIIFQATKTIDKNVWPKKVEAPAAEAEAVEA